MINHPMLLMRDPPPILDVTRPALPKSIEGPLRVVVDRAATDGDKTVEMTYTVECGVVKVQSITETEPVAADPDGWIPWHGGECPVKAGTRIQVKWDTTDFIQNPFTSEGGGNGWPVGGGIIAYRVIE